MSHDRIAPTEVPLLHHNLNERLSRLHFTQPLETQFRAYLQTTQRRTVLFTLYVTTLVWLIYIALDGWRLDSLKDTGHATEFFWGSFALRWPVLACLLFTLYTYHTRPQARQRQELCIAAVLLTISAAVPISSYTLKNLSMPEASVSMVLLVSVALFPLGVRLSVMGPLAVWVSLAITFSGPLVLQLSDEVQQHWLLCGVVWVTFLLSFVAAYYREKGLREQFVLRRLLDWEASHDPLTGLANRRKFQEHFNTALLQAHRQNDPLYLVILDIDHFKLYNDHYGHAAGDAALRQLAQLLQGFAQRPLDLAVRLGGEEFGLVIYGLPTQDIAGHLTKLQATLAATRIPHATSPTAKHLSVSMGAALAGTQDTPDTLFRRADSLLYQAKGQGRNRACVEIPLQGQITVHTLSEQVLSPDALAPGPSPAPSPQRPAIHY